VTLDLIMYGTNNETFPYGFVEIFKSPPGGLVGDHSKDMVGWWWFHLMEGYVDTRKKNLFCPLKLLDNPGLNNNILYGNYGVNRSICKSPGNVQSPREFVGAPLCKDEIPNPSRTLLIVDCGYSITSWWHATDIPPFSLDGSRGVNTAYIPGLTINKDKHLLPSQDRDAIEGRHPNKKVNVGFVDGSVSRKQAEELFVEKKLDGYKNKTPLWAPE
jgi:prepilin-type processing-associated H-X9-DG protein